MSSPWVWSAILAASYAVAFMLAYWNHRRPRWRKCAACGTRNWWLDVAPTADTGGASGPSMTWRWRVRCTNGHEWPADAKHAFMCATARMRK